LLLKWLDARRATEVGVELADGVELRAPADNARASQPNGASLQQQKLQGFLQKFLQRVDREARPLQLNFFQRAKLANSFKWRLLDKGVERELVEELTQALIMRLAVDPLAEVAAPVKSERRPSRRDAAALAAQADSYVARNAYPEAAESYEGALQADPRNAAARVSLAGVFYQQGRLAEAEAEVRRALAIRPDYAEAHSNLGVVLQARARYYDAEQSLRRALKLKPAFLDAQLNLAVVLTFLGRLTEAQASFEKVLRVEPRNPMGLIGLGRVHALQGRFTEAETLFKRALEIDPNRARAWAGLVELRHMTPADAAWLKGAEACAASELQPLDEVSVRFAIGKYHDDVGDYQHAFGSYRRGNELLRAATGPYNSTARASLVDDLIRVYSREALARPHADASDSRRPVLVTGMPRSGTSLVEQVIASHPQAYGAGELDFWSRALHKHAALRSALPGEAVARSLVAGYLRELAARSRDAERVIDKATINSDHLGLIHTLFPNARIIYVRRDPIDTCLSSYFQNFSMALGFTTDLADLADYYRQHRRLVAHWRSALPAATMLDVPYEELVADQETWTRRILEFIGLPWDPRCLAFQRTERAVVTASYWQVRQKIYNSSVGRWRNYERFIGPLLELRGLG
jgi:tetratricopeptide (TPR) repeat protein